MMHRWRPKENLPQMPPDVAKLVAHCASVYGVLPSVVRQRNNQPLAVAARRMAARAMRQQGLSFPVIGKYLGGFHHTTIMNLCNSDGIPVQAFCFERVDWGKL